jgi:hypothetical protein
MSYKKTWTTEDDEKLIDLCKEFKNTKESIKHLRTSWKFILERMILLNIVPEKVKTTLEKRILEKEKKFRCNMCHRILDDCCRFRKPCDQKPYYHCYDCNYIKRQKRYQKFKSDLCLESLLNIRINQAIGSSKKKNRICDITIHDLQDIYQNQKGKCYYSNHEMYVKDLDDMFVLSIDRKDSSQGYTKENVVLCCAMVNYMKSNSNINEFKHIIGKIAENSQNF